jgi:hypothetical protein
MANTKKQTGRGRKQDRARVAGGQDYEVRYEAKKTRRSAGNVKKAVKKVGNSRKRVENRLGTLTSSRWFVRRRRHLRSYLHSVRFGAVRTLILMRRHIFKFPGRWKWDSQTGGGISCCGVFSAICKRRDLQQRAGPNYAPLLFHFQAASSL